MNQEKIGKFISELRKEKNITQIELAKRIKVSDKAVSKWETGRGMPDYGVFDNICKEFNITLSELLNGERNKMDNSVVGEYIEYKDKLHKRNKILFGVIFILIIIVFVLSFYFYNTFREVKVYQLFGKSENFSYSDGLLHLSKIDTIFSKGKLESLKYDESDIYEKIFAIKKDNKYYRLTEFLENYELSKQPYGYNDEISSVMLDYVPNDLYLLVYYEVNNEVLVEEIKINCVLISENDKVLDFSKKPIGEIVKSREVNLNKYDDLIEHKKYLLDNGFVDTRKDRCVQSDFCFIKEIDKNSTISVDVVGKYLMYIGSKDEVILTVLEYDYGNNYPSILFNIDDNKLGVSCRIEYEFSNGKMNDKGGCSKYFEYVEDVALTIDKYFYED